MADPLSRPEVGTRAVCQMCGERVVYKQYTTGREAQVRYGWFHEFTRPRHLATPDNGQKLTPLDQMVNTATKTKFGMLEELAAAFLAKTGLEPDECELVEEHRPGVGAAYYFRKRPKT